MKLHLIPVFVCLAASAAPPAAAQATSTPLTLIVSSETAPAGGWVQIKVFAAAPCQITSGTLNLKLDPAFFRTTGETAVFSATGDAWGSGFMNNRVWGQFTSPSGGIGQLPGLPVLTRSMQVAAGLTTGTTTSVALDLSNSNLNDPSGKPYSITAISGTITVGGTLTIQSVTPGGGPLPAGTVIQIAGTGFDASTTATLDGVSLSPPQLLNPQQMIVALGAAAELTGKHLHLASAAGEQADYFCALPQGGLYFPLTTYESVYSPYPQGHARSFVALNQTRSAVTVTAWQRITGEAEILESVTVQPGELYYPAAGGYMANLYLTASAPIRVMTCLNYIGGVECSPPGPAGSTIAVEPSSSVSWNWQVGTAQPRAASVTLPTLRGGPSNSVSVSPSAQPWLTAQAQGSPFSTLTLTPNASGLQPGTYTGVVTVGLNLPASSAIPPSIPASFR